MSVLRKHLFNLPDGVIYLDGNSLGPLPCSVPDRIAQVLSQEWGQELIRGWNTCHWMAQPARVGNQVARLIGAAPGSVVLGDTLSIKVFQALSSALHMRPERRIILSDTGNFPTDLYMAQGLIALKNAGYELKLVDPDDVVEAITDDVAAVMLTEVDYRSGRRHSMTSVTAATHRAGAVSIWDLAHSAGAVEIDLAGSACEFAVGCTYKYLNGGPGAPAFIYVRPDVIAGAEPYLAGWLGHESPFAFSLDYTPAIDIERMRVGTPSVIQLSALEEAMMIWEDINMTQVRTASVALCELFITLVEARCPSLTLISPRDATQRGSQVSFQFEHGYAVIQALIAHNVIGDFRAPDVMRFGFAPLYIDEADVHKAVDTLAHVLDKQLWDDPVYKVKNRVT